MVGVDAGIVVAYKFPDVHQVIGPQAIKIRWVGGVDDQKGEGEIPTEVAGIEVDLGEAEGREVTPFVDV